MPQITGKDANTGAQNQVATENEGLRNVNYVWDTGSLAWVKMTQPGGSSGGGGAVTVADGADVAQGATTDADTANTAIGRLKKIVLLLSNALTVVVSGSVAVNNFPAVQPVSDNNSTLSIDDGAGSITVDGSVSVSNFPATQPVSAASLPLPTGAATEATLDARTGSLTEAAPASDTASSGLNGRLQRIAQRLTSLIALLPAALSGSGGLKVSQVDRTPTMGSGAVAAPAIGAVIADTGALAAGSYRIQWACAAQDTLAVGKGCVVEYRNAANGATTHRLGGCVAGSSEMGEFARLTVALNERVRIIAGTAAGAASSQYIGMVAAFPVD